MSLAQQLDAEEQRTIAEQLREEELAVFDLLARPAPPLSHAEVKEVKLVARDLLAVLKQQRLVLEWRKRQASRAAVRLAIEETLDRLPPVYTTDTYRQKCDAVYEHVYDAYYGDGRSVYTHSTAAAGTAAVLNGLVSDAPGETVCAVVCG